MKLSKSLGIVEQVRVALSPQYRMASFIGALLGAIVPLSTFVVLHTEIDVHDPLDLRWLVVLGGLLYSASTVYRWGRLAFASAPKAFGFTVLIEGVMTLATDSWLSIAALSYLIAMNAVATGVTLARGTPVDKPTSEEPTISAEPVLATGRLSYNGNLSMPPRALPEAIAKMDARRARDRARRAARRAMNTISTPAEPTS